MLRARVPVHAGHHQPVQGHCSPVFVHSHTCTPARLPRLPGMYGRSRVRLVDLRTGVVIQEQPMHPRLFGEGLAKIGSTLYTLTWQSGKILKWATGGGGLQLVRRGGG